MKARSLLTTLCLFVTTLSACDRPKPQSVDDNRHQPKVVDNGFVLLVLKAEDNPFFQEIRRGVSDALAQIPSAPSLIVRSGTKEGDVSTQRQVLSTFYAQYVDQQTSSRLRAVLLTPSGSSTELTAQIKAFRDRKIPVILIDTRISAEALQSAGTDYNTFVGSSNRQGGGLAADLLKARVPRGGRVLLLNGVDGHETAAERRTGFLERITGQGATGGGRYEVMERTSNWRRDEARSTVANLLAFGHRFQAIFAANDEMALGAAEALRQRGVQPYPVIIGFDAIPEARTAVQEGRLTATLAQDPHGMGVRAVESLSQLWRGEIPAKEYVINVTEVVR